MWHDVAVLGFGVALLAPTRVGAQAARVGRLPVLELPPPGVGACRSDPVSAALRRDGIVSMVSFTSSDSASHHLVSLGMDAKGAPVMLMATIGTRQGRRSESESVSAFFGAHAAVVRGRRSAFTTGSPARLSDDSQLALLPADTAAAQRLAGILRQRCHA